MEFGTRQKPLRRRRLHVEKECHFPYNLQLYSTPPNDNVDLKELDGIAIDRLKGIFNIMYLKMGFILILVYSFACC